MKYYYKILFQLLPISERYKLVATPPRRKKKASCTNRPQKRIYLLHRGIVDSRPRARRLQREGRCI